MTPAARVQTAIELLDQILEGVAPEKALTGWARRSRFAGSKDRLAIRSFVFDAVRCTRSFAAQGGAMTGRGIMLGLLRAQSIDPETLFTGLGYGPSILTSDEAVGEVVLTRAEWLDLPDWLLPYFDNSLGAESDSTALALRQRAPVMLRTNLIKTNRQDAIEALAFEQIVAQPHALASTALVVTEGGRQVSASDAFLSGLVELQDVASQAVVETIGLPQNARILDYCAGGGGKALALAALSQQTVDVWDSDAGRMKDIAKRADRAGATIIRLPEAPTAADSNSLYDLILCDVPCSGSGAWRRSPQGKWLLTAERLRQLRDIQTEILDEAAPLVAQDGLLVYTTCSFLKEENINIIQSFITDNIDWTCDFSRQFLPSDGGDGFFVAHLKKVSIG
jgi:16S rRNA (cytosine967-C5)-methyltransferase